MAAIKDLPLPIGIKLIKKARDKQNNKMAWEMWISLLPKMAEGKLKFKSFEKFKKDLIEGSIIEQKRKQSAKKDTKKIQKELFKIIAVNKVGEMNGNI